MPNRLRPHLQPARRALRAIDWRRWYAASMVGLAAFLVGLILWPSQPLVRRTTAVIEVDTSVLPAARLMELETEFLAIQDELLSEERLSGMIAELAGAGGSSQNSIDALAFREKLHVVPDELPSKGEENPGSWWIRFAMNGSGSDMEMRLVNRVATEFALEWQRRFVQVEQSHEFRDIRSAMIDVLRRQSELSEQADELSREQASALKDAMERFSRPIGRDSSGQALALEGSSNSQQSADARAFQLASSSSRDLQMPSMPAGSGNTHSFPPIGERSQIDNSIENPQWRFLNDRLQQLQQRRIDLQQANPQWNETDWELRQIAEEANFVRDQLSRVSQFVPREPLESGSGWAPSRQPIPGQSESSQGIARVETNQFYRPPQDGFDEVNAQRTAAQLARFSPTTEEELASIQSAVLAPMEALRSTVIANKNAHDQALQALNSIVLKEPEIRQSEAHLVQPAATYLMASTNGTWRIIFLMLTSISGAVFFGTVFRTELDSRLSSYLEIESQLGVPVIGHVGKSGPDHEPNWLERLQPANAILRSAEGIVFALFALVFLTVLFNSRMAVDLAESPLLTISEILGSLLRRG